jgi:hypothetical protein
MRVCPFSDCGHVVFGKQTYCSEEHKRAAWRQANPEARDREKEVSHLRYAAANNPRLWPCKQCGGLMLNTRLPTNVCSNCSPDSQWVPVRVAPRPADDPLRPAMVYFGTMNVFTRYMDADTVMLVCGYPEAMPTLEAFVERLDGVSVIEQSPLGIPMLEGVVSVETLRAIAPRKAAAEALTVEVGLDGAGRWLGPLAFR